MPLASQFGIKAESTFATAVTVDRFFEFVDEDISPNVGRIKVVTKRAGQRVRRGDRSTPYLNGASGTLAMPVMTKNHGILFGLAMGAIATTGPTDSAYTHTATIGALDGDFFTAQADRPFNPSGTSQAFTWAGCKITSAEWSMTTGEAGYLTAKYGIDAATQATGTALASASYVASSEPHVWTGAAATIGGSAVEASDFTISLTNAVKTDRHYLRSSATKKEQLENGMRTIAFSIGLDFVDLTQYNRVVSATRAGMQSAVVLTVTGPTLLGATTYPSVTFTMPQAEFGDVQGVNAGGDDPIKMTLTGEATYDGTNSPLTIAYVSGDTTA